MPYLSELALFFRRRYLIVIITFSALLSGCSKLGKEEAAACSTCSLSTEKLDSLVGNAAEFTVNGLNDAINCKHAELSKYSLRMCDGVLADVTRVRIEEFRNALMLFDGNQAGRYKLRLMKSFILNTTDDGGVVVLMMCDVNGISAKSALIVVRIDAADGSFPDSNLTSQRRDELFCGNVSIGHAALSLSPLVTTLGRQR